MKFCLIPKNKLTSKQLKQQKTRFTNYTIITIQTKDKENISIN